MNIMIVGAAGGIGQLLAKNFDFDWNYLYLVGHKEKVYRPSKAKYIEIYTDFTKETSVEHVFSRIKGLDLLINAQGTVANSLIKNMELDDWNKVMDVNVKSIFLTCKCAYPIMNPFGSIINFSSVLATTGMKGASNYAASKGAIESFTKSFALEAISDAIFVNCIALGYFNVGMGLKLEGKIVEKATRKIPLHYFGHEAEIVKLVNYINVSV